MATTERATRSKSHSNGRTRSNGSGPSNRARTNGAAKDDAPKSAIRKDDAPHLHVRGSLFDADADDREVAVSRNLIDELEDDQLLWVDVAEADDDEIDELARLFELPRHVVRALRHPVGRPRIDRTGSQLHLSVTALASDEHQERPIGIGVLAAPNVLVTVHREPLEFLDDFRSHVAGGTTGLVDSPAFLAAMLDWLLNGYFRVLEVLEREADRLDHRALDPRSERDLLADLVRLRRRVAAVRRALAPHREVFAALTRPDLTEMEETDAGPYFRANLDRLERAIDAVENARELVVGSFEVYMTRTAQRTNEVMKVLTLASVLLLPGALLAGIMGMNFKEPFFDAPNAFWIVVAAMIAIAVVTTIVARLRRWI